MACGALTYGFDYECSEGIGGIKPGSILVTQWDNVSSYTVTSGEVTALTQAGATNFYRYQVRKFIAGDTTEGVNDPKMGTVTFTSTLTFTLFNLSASKNTQLELLMSKPLAVIYQDNNDVYHVLGITNGAEVTSVQRVTGVDKQDMNGYTLTITAEEGVLPYTVSSATVGGLTISGELS